MLIPERFDLAWSEVPAIISVEGSLLYPKTSAPRAHWDPVDERARLPGNSGGQMGGEIRSIVRVILSAHPSNTNLAFGGRSPSSSRVVGARLPQTFQRHAIPKALHKSRAPSPD